MVQRLISSFTMFAFFSAALVAAPRKAPPKKPAAAVPAAAAAAAETKTEAPPTKHYVSEELMESIKNKRYLNDHDFERKKGGVNITGLPLINSDPNTGIGYGARLYLFNNGEKEDPLFRRTPYRQRVYAQFFQTTNGYQYHELNFDSPYIGNTLYRLRASLVFEKNTWANFFGIGASTLNPLNGNGTSFDKYADYYSEINKIDAAGNTNAAFTKYSYTRPAGVLTLERDLFGGIVRPQFGVQVGKYTINDLYNSQVKTDSGSNATSNKTLLTNACEAAAVQGCAGGWNNTVRVGFAIDTRDFEPDPNKGQLFEAIAEVSNKAYGSEFNYARYTLSEKVFFSPFPQFADVVLAGRVAYTQSVGDVPFYAMNQISSTENTYLAALGGLRSLRGYKDSRFVANNMALANFEIRWTMFDFTVLGQNFAPILVPFFDIGSPFDTPQKFTSSVWRYSYGAGIRIAWNQATIIMVDYARSQEDSNMFINFNHIF
jgi:hypothetical protein